MKYRHLQVVKITVNHFVGKENYCDAIGVITDVDPQPANQYEVAFSTGYINWFNKDEITFATEDEITKAFVDMVLFSL